MTVIDDVGNSFWRIQFELPSAPWTVNSYVALDNQQATIIDCGLGIGARALWNDVFEGLGLLPAQVARIIITHFHPDHIGGAGALAALTAAPVWASRLTIEQSPAVWGAGSALMFSRIREHLRSHGLDEARPAHIERSADRPESAIQTVRLPDAWRELRNTEIVEFAGEPWQVVFTPGHADGHLCLYAPQSGRLLSGDHLLEHTSPSIGLYPDSSPDPLLDYLASLERIRNLEPATVLPGHGEQFAGASARCEALVAHHRDRADHCLVALQRGACTAAEVASTVFGDHHDRMNRRFAVAESVAHLEYLRLRGEVDRSQEPGSSPGAHVWRYRRATPAEV